MSKKKLYWSLQIFGWSAYIVFDFLVTTLQIGFRWEVFFLSLANILLAIILTHIYRLIVRRWNWVELSVPVLIFRMSVSVLILGSIMVMFNIPFDKQYIAEVIENQPFLFWNYLSNWSRVFLTWVLAYTIYHYVEQKRLTDLETVMLKTSMREAEAKVLRAQLNPHFTFNALNSIRALISENPQKAIQSVTQLSNLLRNALLADRRKTVELREEIKTVEDYLELEKVRYENRLTYHIEANPNVLYWQVPPMMLQTLVENGIKHGVSKMVGGGEIELRAYETDSRLKIEIRNSGKLKKESSEGVGLLNTAERLSILYGIGGQFSIRQEGESVVLAELTIPMITVGVDTEPTFKKM